MIELEPFWLHVPKGLSATACWIWTGAVNGDGYGTCVINEQPWLAHRLSWVSFYRDPLRPDQAVAHTCRQRRCVNPMHLFIK